MTDRDLVVQQRTIGDSDKSSAGVDGETSTGGIDERIGRGVTAIDIAASNCSNAGQVGSVLRDCQACCR